MLECALRKYQDLVLLLPAVFATPELNKTRERGKKIYKIRVSLTLRYSKCKINFNSCGGKFNKFGPSFSLRLRVITKVLRRT